MQRVLRALNAARWRWVAVALCAALAAANTVAQDEAAAARSDGRAVWTQAQAFALMARLRVENTRLAALKATQSALIEWNRERLETGARPVRLPAALCGERGLGEWCALLPATFERTDDESEGVEEDDEDR